MVNKTGSIRVSTCNHNTISLLWNQLTWWFWAVDWAAEASCGSSSSSLSRSPAVWYTSISSFRIWFHPGAPKTSRDSDGQKGGVGGGKNNFLSAWKGVKIFHVY